MFSPQAPAPSSKTSSNAQGDERDGWEVEDEDWAPLKIDDEIKTTKPISNNDFLPVVDNKMKSISSYKWENTDDNSTVILFELESRKLKFFLIILFIIKQKKPGGDSWGTEWDDGNTGWGEGNF